MATCRDCNNHESCKKRDKLLFTVDKDMELVYQHGVEKSCNDFNVEVTAESAIKSFNEANNAIREAKLKQMVEEERQKVKAYEQIAKVHSAYISILLKRLGAAQDNPQTFTKAEIKEALEHYEARGIPLEDGYSLYCEVIEDGIQAEVTTVENEERN